MIYLVHKQNETRKDIKMARPKGSVNKAAKPKVQKQKIEKKPNVSLDKRMAKMPLDETETVITYLTGTNQVVIFTNNSTLVKQLLKVKEPTKTMESGLQFEFSLSEYNFGFIPKPKRSRKAKV